MDVVFVLPSAGGGGGAHSIVQETIGLSRLGIRVSIATPAHLAPQFRVKYPELEARGVANPTFRSTEELSNILAGRSLAVATTALSVSPVLSAWELIDAGPRPRLGYYIQDYEPLFYAPGTSEWMQARASFTALKDGLLFAKTDWLCSVVEANHNVRVHRVQASLDHDTYFPRHRVADSEVIRVTAMVRPQTPRRAPKRTIRALEQLASRFESRVELTYFGCESIDLARLGINHSPRISSLGILSRVQVASTLRHSDLFLDLSDFQAFGRTGLEAMACGCIPIVPIFGGTGEYARHGFNSFVVDTRSDEQVFGVATQFIDAQLSVRNGMRQRAIETALQYSISRAAYGEYELFRRYL